jgi:recombination protein U
MSTDPIAKTRANHSNLGRDWERELESVHDFYRASGRADIVKNPHEWVFITDNQYRSACVKYSAGMFARTANGRWMMRSRSDVDFSGGGAGFSVCFDAKACASATFPLSNLTDHQIRRLKQSARCGTVAGFMIRMSKFSRVFFVPVAYADRRHLGWLTQGRRARPGTASLSLADLEENAIEIPCGANRLWDWLACLIKEGAGQ